MKKTVIGILSACMILGASATAIYANDDKETEEENLKITIETFEPGTMDRKVDGIEMDKEVLEVEDMISAEVNELEEGALDEEIEGKEMLMKEIIED